MDFDFKANFILALMKTQLTFYRYRYRTFLLLLLCIIIYLLFIKFCFQVQYREGDVQS